MGKKMFSNMIAKFADRNELKYIVFCVFFLIGIYMLLDAKIFDEILPYATFLENQDDEQFIKNFNDEMELIQEFTSPEDFECLTLSCSNHEMQLDGYMVVEVFEADSGKLILKERREFSSIQYGIPVEFHFEQICKENISYEIRITAYETKEDSLGFFGYIPTTEQPKATLNGQEMEYVLSIGAHTHTDFFNGQLVAVILILIIGMVGIVNGLLKNRTPEVIFLYIAIPVGISFMCLMLANIAHDVDVHFAKSYHYANVLLGIGDQDSDGMISMRQDDLDLLYDTENIKNARNAQKNYYIWNNWSWGVKNDRLVNGVEWRWADTGNILSYLPGVLGIILARVLGLGTYPMLYLARIFYFIFYLVGIYWAIKIVPVGKHLMTFLALLPMAMQQAVNITYDNTTYVITFLYIAYVLKTYFCGLNKKEKIWILILCCGLGLCKGGIYTPLLFILFFLPKEHFGTLKKKLLFLCIAGILTVCVTLMSYGSTILNYVQPVKTEIVDTMNEAIKSDEVITNMEENENIVANENVRYGMGYMISAPKQFVGLIIRTIEREGGLYISSMLGSNPAWSIQQMPIWSYALAGILLLLVKNGIGEEKYIIDNKLRIGLISSFGLVCFAHFALFLIETSRSYNYIWGIQGRYFLACSFFLLLGLRNNNVVQREGSDKVLYLGYYMQLFLYIVAYFELFMIQFYNS